MVSRETNTARGLRLAGVLLLGVLPACGLVAEFPEFPCGTSGGPSSGEWVLVACDHFESGGSGGGRGPWLGRWQAEPETSGPSVTCDGASGSGECSLRVAGPSAVARSLDLSGSAAATIIALVAVELGAEGGSHASIGATTNWASSRSIVPFYSFTDEQAGQGFWVQEVEVRDGFREATSAVGFACTEGIVFLVDDVEVWVSAE